MFWPVMLSQMLGWDYLSNMDMNKEFTSKLVQNKLGYWEVANKPTETELEAYYAQKYYQDLKGAHQVKYSETELACYEVKVSQRAAMIAQLFPELKSKKYLDVGCGEGFELTYFQQQGWHVKGLDFSSDGMSKQNPGCLPFLQTGNVYELLNSEIESGRTYDVVWLQNVLEHVIEPEALLSQLLKLVTPQGCVVVTVPNDFSALQTEALNSDKISKPFWVALPDHLSYFDAKSLRATVEANGWDCKAVTADFPIDWFLMNEHSNYVENPKAGKAAHHARVDIENLINQQSTSAVLSFWIALAEIGMGRNISAFITPKMA